MPESTRSRLLVNFQSQKSTRLPIYSVFMIFMEVLGCRYSFISFFLKSTRLEFTRYIHFFFKVEGFFTLGVFMQKRLNLALHHHGQAWLFSKIFTGTYSISRSVIPKTATSSPGIAYGKNTDAMWCAVIFLLFFHSWGVYSVFSIFS